MLLKKKKIFNFSLSLSLSTVSLLRNLNLSENEKKVFGYSDFEAKSKKREEKRNLFKPLSLLNHVLIYN
jgi:hypothetical protein